MGRSHRSVDQVQGRARPKARTAPREAHAPRARISLVWVALLAFAAGGARAGGVLDVAAGPPDRFDVVVIDAGHGGDDEGARGHRSLVEKDLVLDMSVRLKDRLESQGIEVVLTRASDEFVPLEKRTAIANDARADLFLSIHANAARARSARGFETFFLSLEASDETARQLAERENAAFAESTGRAWNTDDPLLSILGDMMATEQSHESDHFARLVDGHFRKVEGRSSRGVKQAPFVVLMGLQMPAALIEVGFITNPQEEASLRSAKHRDEVVRAIAEAVTTYGHRYDARRGYAAD